MQGAEKIKDYLQVFPEFQRFLVFCQLVSENSLDNLYKNG